MENDQGVPGMCDDCKGTGRQPAQPATDERGRPMTYWGGQPAHPGSGENPMYSLVAEGHEYAGHLVAEGIGGHSIVSDLTNEVSRLQSALAAERHAFQNFHRSLCARFGYLHDPADFRRDQVSLEEHIARQLTASQQRIAALHASLRTYGWHKPECDYMQEELPCTCGFLTAVERDFPQEQGNG